MMRRISTLVIVLVVVLPAASCGDDADVGPTTGPSSQSIAEFMGWADFDWEAADQAHADLMTRVGDMALGCMTEHGLDYTPWTPPEVMFDLEELPTAESLLRYGYGMFAMPLEQYRYETAHADEIGNPNEAIHAQNAPEGVDYMGIMWECEDTAETTLIGENPEIQQLVDQAWTPLHEEMDAMYAEIEGDQRLADAEQGWSACMAERGYEFADEEALEAYLWTRFDEFDAMGGTPALWEGVLTEADLQPFVDEEMAIATADAACRGGLDAVRADLERAYESRFIAEHRAELEEIRPLEEQLMEQLRDGVRW
jgi:hypothetical protein